MKPVDTTRDGVKTLDMYLSLRSPYTWIALPRTIDLARHYGAELRLRFVLPMVMRGLAVPAAKRRYIVMDTKREATRLGLAKLSARAGISEGQMFAALAAERCRQVAEENRQEMLVEGIWGVPSFRISKGPVHWGQDRLWLVEKELRSNY